MSRYYANADVWIGNLDTDDEAEHIASLIETALADYQMTVSISVNAYQEQQ